MSILSTGREIRGNIYSIIILKFRIMYISYYTANSWDNWIIIFCRLRLRLHGKHCSLLWVHPLSLLSLSSSVWKTAAPWWENASTAKRRKDKQILIYDGWKSEICIKLKARRDSWRWAVREWVSEWCEIIKNDFQNVLSTPFCAVDMMSGSLSFVCAIAFIWMTPDIEWDGENKRRRCNFSSKFFFFRNSCSREQKLHIEDQPSDSFLFDETLAS